MTDAKHDLEMLNVEARDIWNKNASFWDEAMADGNQFQKVLVGPASERLLHIEPGETILDIACGNGVFSRRMAKLGAHVVAADFSDEFLKRARARSAEYGERIEYQLIDATKEDQLLALGTRRFDAAVCNMALMDLADIGPLLNALARLLRPTGRFVFSITHPCFHHPGARVMAEEEDRDGELVVHYALKVDRYLSLGISKGVGIVGQPVPQIYFFRTLSRLLGECFTRGWVLDAIEEPQFQEGAVFNRLMSWAHLKEIPPVLVARLRLAANLPRT